MLLTIDQGNTYIKYAVFKGVNLIEKTIVEINKAENIFLNLLEKYPDLQNGIFAGVGKVDPQLINLWTNSLQCLVVNSETKVPFANLYETPKTLGLDRLVLAAGASLIHPNTNVLIIDAGSCITYDFITAENQYIGGGISPGINMRYKALNYYTAKLPLLEKNETEILIGKNSSESIHSGIINGVIFEIEGFISKYSVKNTNLKIILTGGDTNFLANRLKSTIFADENFLLRSLQQLYTYTHKK